MMREFRYSFINTLEFGYISLISIQDFRQTGPKNFSIGKHKPVFFNLYAVELELGLIRYQYTIHSPYVVGAESNVFG